MKYLRIVVSAFLVVLGSMVLVAWALSQKAAESIEEGTAAENLVVKVVESEQTAEVIANGLIKALDEQVDGQAGTLALNLLDDQIYDLTVDLVQSEQFQSVLLSSADRAQNFLLSEISDPDREPAPFGIYLDVGDRLNTRIDEIPVAGPFIPELEIDPVEVELIPADTFEDVRTGYQGLQWAATWFIWIGLALIAGGIAMAPKWKRFLPRALIGAGGIGVGIALTLNFFGPRTIAAFVPGGREGGAGTLVEDVIADTALKPVTNILLVLGLIALALALVFLLLLKFVPGLDGDRPVEGDATVGEPDESTEPTAVNAGPTSEASAPVADTKELETSAHTDGATTPESPRA
ncbi:hypothetical protein [Demequina sediminicola]|uniref:hypothetical protein n=1 Tax=Demequina sediminicola TaxID=1095026 RepID=UPI000A62B977|nr:hypothetical protein [Demequina sediminicola]